MRDAGITEIESGAQSVPAEDRSRALATVADECDTISHRVFEVDQARRVELLCGCYVKTN